MIAWSAITWDFARAGGFVAYALVTLAVTFGLTLSMQWRSSSWPRWATQDLHRYLALLALIFTALHTVAIWLDPFMRFTPLEVLVPMMSHYRPIWVALGIVAAYLMIAIYLSERLQKRVGYDWWRRLHYGTFLVYILATVHGLGSGSDSRAAWAMVMYGGSVLIVGGLLTLRLLRPATSGTRHPRVAWGVGMGILALVLWAFIGPLAPGWTRAANLGGTPTKQVAITAPRPVRVPFHAQISGTATEAGGGFQGAEIQITSQVQSGPRGQLLVALDGNPTDQGFAVQGGRVELIPASGSSCQGQIGQLQGSTLHATCVGSNGAAISLVMSLNIDGGGKVSGTLDGSAR